MNLVPYRAALFAAVVVGAPDAQSARLTLLPDSCCDVFGWSASRAGDLDGDGFADVIIGARRDELPGLDPQFNSGSVTSFSGAIGTILWKVYGDGENQEFGHRVAGIADFDGDGVGDVLVGNHVFADQTGSATILSGADGSELLQLVGGSPSDNFGIDVGSAGDVDGDGVGDFVVGARWAEEPGMPADFDSGAAFVYSGVDAGLLFSVYGDSADDGFGWSVNGIGDVDGDGRSDVLVGAPQCNGPLPGCTEPGYVDVFSGASGTRLYRVTGSAAAGQFGLATTSTGDVTGDGVPDFAVGAPFDSTVAGGSGSLTMCSGVDGGTVWSEYGTQIGDSFGFSAGAVGDLNGDSVRELVVGAPETCNAFVGPTCPSPGFVEVRDGTDGALLFSASGDADEDQFGFSVEGVGDTNGDGVPDFVVGARYSDHVGGFSGSARLFSGAALALSANEHLAPLATGVTQALALDAGPAHADSVYWIFGSASGTAPGVAFGAVLVPLNVDAYFALTLSKPFAGIFTAFLGVLDADGRANAAWTLPLGSDPGLAGVTLHHAFTAGSVFGTVDFASNAAPITLVP